MTPLVGLLLIAAAGAVAWFALHAGGGGGAGRQRRQDTPPVGVATVGRGDVPIVQQGLGTVTPLATVTVRTQINGQLQTVGFTEGQIVKRGDFLAQIDARPYIALRDQYAGQKAKDEASARQAAADLARYTTLLRQDSIARQQADDQRFLLAQDQGAIRADQAQIDGETLNIAYCHIVAPVGGRVGLRQVDQGNYVQTSDANGLVVLTQLQPISVIFTVPEDALPAITARLASGATLPVEAWDRANAAKIADGRLLTLDNQIDVTTGTLKIRALFANPDNRLFPNQFVNAHLLVDTHRGVVTVRPEAVQHGAPGSFVYLVRDGKVATTVVKTGPTEGDLMEIDGGLSPGDQVVVDGADRLRDGAPVHVQTIDGKPVVAAGATGGPSGGPSSGAAQHGGHHHRHAEQSQ